MADRDPAVVGARIARRRQQLGWTQIELADRLGVSPSTVANWERGASYPKKKLGLVEHVLGVTLDEPEPAEPPLSPGLLRAIREQIPDAADQERVIEFIRLVRSGRLPLPPRPPGADTGDERRNRSAGLAG